MRSQYFQPLPPQTVAPVAAAMHWAESESGSEKMATVIVSHDEYRGTFCPSPMIKFTPEATALINHKLVGRFKPPPPPTMWCNCCRIGARQSLSALLNLDSLSFISFCSQFLLLQHSSAGIDTSYSPLSWLALLNFIQCSIPAFPNSSAGDGSSSIPTGPPRSGLLPVHWILHCFLVTHPLYGVPPLGEHSSIPNVAPLPELGAPMAGLALLDFIMHSWPPPPLFSALLP